MKSLTDVDQTKTLDAVAALSIKVDGEYFGYHKGHDIHSYYQPIYRVSDSVLIGHEALMRPFKQGMAISPIEMIHQDFAREECVFLDRLCRYLHVNNFQYIHESGGLLFLNVSPNVIVHGRHYGNFFSELLDCVGLPAERIVMEVLEKSVDDPRQLDYSLDYYRNIGCQIAIDDFGTGMSNFDRLECIHPDIIKLDRDFINDFRSGDVMQYERLHRLAEDIGAKLLQEGIETEDELELVRAHDIHWMQGFHLSEPRPLQRDVLFNLSYSGAPRLNLV